MKFLDRYTKVTEYADGDWKITREDYQAILRSNPSGGELLKVHGREYVVGWTVKNPQGITVQWGPPTTLNLVDSLTAG
jgi:hypothetical protein